MGEWRDGELSYLRPNRTPCDLCGQPIPGRYWGAAVEGDPKVFCRPEHERLYLGYWLPRYGVDAGAA